MMPSNSSLAFSPAVGLRQRALGWLMTASPNATDARVITGEKTMPLIPTVALARLLLNRSVSRWRLTNGVVSVSAPLLPVSISSAAAACVPSVNDAVAGASRTFPADAHAHVVPPSGAHDGR